MEGSWVYSRRSQRSDAGPPVDFKLETPMSRLLWWAFRGLLISLSMVILPMNLSGQEPALGTDLGTIRGPSNPGGRGCFRPGGIQRGGSLRHFREPIPGSPGGVDGIPAGVRVFSSAG